MTRSLDQRLLLAEDIFRRIEPDLRFFGFGSVSPGAAEDVLQEVLKAVATNLGKFQGGTEPEFWAWCYRIARNKLSDQFRRQGSDRLQPMPADELWELVEASGKTQPLSPADVVDVLGQAAASSSVMVNSAAADYRRGQFFDRRLPVSNASTPVWQSVAIAAVPANRSGHIYVAPATESFGYDADGNLTSDSRWTYTWDAENRLVGMTPTSAAITAGAPNLKLTFDYDYRGRRIRKLVQFWNGITYATTSDLRFVYDGWNLEAELDGMNNKALLRSYQWGLDLSGSLTGAGGVGGLLWMKSAGGNPQFAAYDGNGNVAGLVDGSNGTLSADYEYGPFGELIRITGTQAVTNVFRFSTKYQDVEDGLVYYGYRYYNTGTGKWLSRDPLEEREGRNLYGFVSNDPIRRADSLGLYATTIVARCACRAAARAEAGSAGGPLGIVVVAVGAVATEFVLVDAALAIEIDQLQAENKRTAEQIGQKDLEYNQYKNRCNEKPPADLANHNNDPKKLCELWRWLLQRNKDCMSLRQAFSNKWYGGPDDPHKNTIRDLENSIKNLEDKIKRLCEPCPETAASK